LSTLLSQVLVAFTIELDNEFERQMQHVTTVSRQAGHAGRGPWLVSFVMWSNFMRFVGEKGTPLRDLQDQARMTNLGGLQRWGYVVIHPDPADSRRELPRRDWVVHATRKGRTAQQVWRPLAGIIEERGRHDSARTSSTRSASRSASWSTNSTSSCRTIYRSPARRN